MSAAHTIQSGAKFGPVLFRLKEKSLCISLAFSFLNIGSIWVLQVPNTSSCMWLRGTIKLSAGSEGNAFIYVCLKLAHRTNPG